MPGYSALDSCALQTTPEYQQMWANTKVRSNQGGRETIAASLTLAKAAVNKKIQALRQSFSRLDVRMWLSQVTFE